MKHVVVSINIGGSSGRDCLSGIFRFMNTGVRWRLHLDNDRWDCFAGAPEWPDGIITEFGRKVVPGGFPGPVGCPVVFTDYGNLPTTRPVGAEFIKLDDVEIGRQAFRHLSGLGSFGSFVFATNAPSTKWSTGRERGFLSCAGESGREVHSLTILPKWHDRRDASAFTARLSRLPRPVAVFASWDVLALRMIDLLGEAGLSVPDHAVVLGVDNDEIICRGSVPALSSILPNHEMLGFTAAKELRRLMNGGKPRDLTIADSVRDILSRDSTRIIQPGKHLIRAAKVYIDAHAREDIRPRDVVRHLGVSRTLADRRFREFNDLSIGQEIARARIEEIKRRVMSSNNTLVQIAHQAGFSSGAALTRYFKHETGLTPSGWRRSIRNG